MFKNTILEWRTVRKQFRKQFSKVEKAKRTKIERENNKQRIKVDLIKLKILCLFSWECLFCCNEKVLMEVFWFIILNLI